MNPITSHSSGATRAPRVQPPSEEQIAALAFSLHLQHGGQHGRDQEDWLTAEEMLLWLDATANASPSAQMDHWIPVTSTPLIEHAHARDERHSPSRVEIRQMNTSHRPAARQSQRGRH